MPITVKRKVIIQEMAFASDESTAWCDLDTGQLHWIPDEAFRMAEKLEGNRPAGSGGKRVQ